MSKPTIQTYEKMQKEFEAERGGLFVIAVRPFHECPDCGDGHTDYRDSEVLESVTSEDPMELLSASDRYLQPLYWGKGARICPMSWVPA